MVVENVLCAHISCPMCFAAIALVFILLGSNPLLYVSLYPGLSAVEHDIEKSHAKPTAGGQWVE